MNRKWGNATHSSSTASTTSPSILRRALLASLPAAAAAALLPAPSGPLHACGLAFAGHIVDEAVTESVFDSAGPSVVSIVQFKETRNGGETFEPLGSGLVFDGYGHVVTNYHVVGQFVLDRTGAAGIKVVLQRPDGSSLALPASVLGTDATRDLAVLGILGEVPSELKPLPVAASGDLKVGQSVYALGARYGEGKSMSAGVVSGLERAIPAPTGNRIYGAIQTDASVNAGNSGGPLVDSFGHLVGLNTAPFLKKSTGRGSGVAFALPSDMLLEVVPNLIIYGSAAARGVRGATA